MAVQTAPHKPPTRQSDEATIDELQLALDQGMALQEAFQHMTKEVANDGNEVSAGDYHIGYAVEEAEGMYQMSNGKLEWMEPEEKNVHLEISVRDGADGRFVPALKVHATLIDEGGREIGTHEQPFLWHPWLYHYGRNWNVPGDGNYTLRVHIDPPEFGRHDKKNGLRYMEPVDVEFTNVKIKTGSK